MCGIVGIFDPNQASLRNQIVRMRETVSYRGPDGKGYILYKKDSVALGHRRLSILDLSEAGNQPMVDAFGSLTIVHNGEVYNYLELRRELEEAGYHFKSRTDTEVILAAYHRWGPKSLDRFNGMFAFAIWDAGNRTLFLARDRLGIKPLYYYWNNKQFIFASEIKSILVVLKERPEINHSLIEYYMSFGYIPGENTLIRGIKRLLPGHYLIFDGEKVFKKKYWDLYFENDRENHSFSYYKEGLKYLLNDSIDLRLRSDVPLGIFLSGGIDSSAVVALLAPRVEKRVKTFSVAYDFGAPYNETKYARIVANKFSTDHFEFIVSPREFRDFIPRFAYLMDEPVTESAAISLYYIAKLAKEHVTVVLSGEGSDELFAGYDFYFYNFVIEKCRKLLVGKRLPRVIKHLCGNLPDCKLRKYLQMFLLPMEERYRGISTYLGDNNDIIFTDDYKSYLAANRDSEAWYFISNLFEHTKNNDVLSRMLYFDTKTWLVDDLLIKADRMSMAASLELRVPFLDHRVVEFAAKIPSKYKINGKTTKYILKQMLKDSLPHEIIYRKKMGFPTPLKILFRGELAEFAQDLLVSESSRIKLYFRQGPIRELLRRHVAGDRDNHRVIWQLLVLEVWLQAIDRENPLAEN